MKIDDGLKDVADLQAKSLLHLSRIGNTNQRQDSVQDSVDLTAQASLMRSLETTLKDMPDTNLGKVEEVRKAIAEGSFQVDEKAVADKLVEETMENLRLASKHL